MECILLAGGLGTRLSGVVSDVPKCMAPVAGEPFLSHLLSYLEQQFVDHVILSLGYQSSVVVDYLRQKAFTFKVSWVLEPEPMGTGGGIKRALSKSKENQVFILNGDTLFAVDLHQMREAFDPAYKAMLALKPMENYDRYGSVTLDEQQNILSFEEKKFKAKGLINGGIYLLNKERENLASFPEKFSFEKDFLEQTITDENGQACLKGYVSDRYFIDIGIPADYLKAQEELKR